MVHLAFVLIGSAALRSRWLAVTAGGGFILLAGALMVVILAMGRDTGGQANALAPMAHGALGLLFLGHAAVAALALGDGDSASRRLIAFVQAVGFALIGGMFVTASLWDPVALGILFAAAFLFDGGARLATATVVRFGGWPYFALHGLLELVLALVILADWPLPRGHAIAIGVGALFGLSGSVILRFGLQLRTLESEAAILNLPLFAGRGWYDNAPVLIGDDPPPDPNQAPLIVRIWTPVGAAVDAQRRLIIDRYLITVDGSGEYSTGHAAIERRPDVYISHHPASDLAVSPADRVRCLNAGERNNVPGKFLPSYEEEVAWWCAADQRVDFHHYSDRRLRAFWAGYRQDSTYNLTNRNCSVVVAAALDAALEGAMANRHPLRTLAWLLVNPDLWAAALLRTRAETFSWTPGMVLDYARALHRIVEPSATPWSVRATDFLNRLRRTPAEASPP